MDIKRKALVRLLVLLAVAVVALALGGTFGDLDLSNIGGGIRNASQDDLLSEDVALVECYYGADAPLPGNWRCADGAKVYVDGVLVTDDP